MKDNRVYSFFILSMALSISCTPKTQTSTEESSVSPTTSTSTKESKVSKSASTKKVTDEDTFTVSLPKDGTVFTIKPKPGYKINADFPHRAILSAGDVKETAQTDHNEKRLIFNMVAESKLPQTGVQAETSFSVCNDQMCKLYKKSYQW